MSRETFAHKCAQKGIYDSINYICKLYQKGQSCEEIAENLQNEHGIAITGKAISDKIKEKIPLRTYSERKKTAIASGRMIYHKKPEHEKYKRKGLSYKIRMEILKRDSYACVICGNSPKTGYSLEIHHINEATNNNMDNLRTLCFSCHKGLHYTK